MSAAGEQPHSTFVSGDVCPETDSASADGSNARLSSHGTDELLGRCLSIMVVSNTLSVAIMVQML